MIMELVWTAITNLLKTSGVLRLFVTTMEKKTSKTKTMLLWVAFRASKDRDHNIIKRCLLFQNHVNVSKIVFDFVVFTIYFKLIIIIIIILFFFLLFFANRCYCCCSWSTKLGRLHRSQGFASTRRDSGRLLDWRPSVSVCGRRRSTVQQRNDCVCWGRARRRRQNRCILVRGQWRSERRSRLSHLPALVHWWRCCVCALPQVQATGHVQARVRKSHFIGQKVISC